MSAKESLSQLAYLALNKWGHVEQMRHAGEECIELALALRHHETGKADMAAVAEEVAGVEVMLAQLRQIIPNEMLADAREQQRAKLREALEVPS